VADFLARLKLGRPPDDFLHPMDFSARTEERIFAELCERGVPEHYRGDMVSELQRPGWEKVNAAWQAALAEGMVAAVTSAVNVAAGVESRLGAGDSTQTRGQRARAWFINHYPLLGALAASFDIVEDPDVCRRLDISIAAVNVESREIFINPGARLNDMECRFVMAHELLHVGLRHDARCRGRDHELWNISADYVINGWLVEMQVGAMPSGLLYDPDLKGLSAEAIYDRIVTDMRRYRKLATLRGVGLGDMLEPRRPGWWESDEGVTLDEFYRRSLSQGLVYHQEAGRGLLPAGLVEEIGALSQPPIPWDVELAKWFDEHFPPVEKRRSYARASRRQSATPDIPRPHWVPVTGAEDGRTFGVVLDTSGSMDRVLLAKALGAIASYSISREVGQVRVVFCDAAAYDQGYMPPEDIAGRVKVRGRGGTVLQPGIDLLVKAEDFPMEGPLLIITDGMCDRLTIGREHAFLIPEGRHLPFVPKGKVFRIK
jgi:predicted metal-dependent peptidase